VVPQEQARRAADIQPRTADWITALTGSVNLACLHAVPFTARMPLTGPTPWPALTLIVPPEAIFPSTPVMTGQNRQAELQQAKADHDLTRQELELTTNTEPTPRHPPAHDRAAQAAHRPPHPAGQTRVPTHRTASYRHQVTCRPWG
jgi:hypothetical protein